MDEFDDEGNAAELRFGKEFTGDDIQFLMNDEVHVLLDRHRLKNEQQRANSMNETLTKTLQYTSKQAASKDPDTLTGVVQELR
ncbi:NRPB4, partial [Symbiodinium microadriaticum]